MQTLVAVTAGQLATLLPQWVLLTITTVIFGLGAVVLLRTARGAEAGEQEQEAEYAEKAATARTGWRAVGASTWDGVACNLPQRVRKKAWSRVCRPGMPATNQIVTKVRR